MNYLKEAYYLAKKAHEGQKRRDGSDYFVNHVERVFLHLVANSGTLLGYYKSEKSGAMNIRKEVIECVYAASLLHDVIEDTDVKKEDLVDKFPVMVVELVEILTKKKNEIYFDYIMRINDCGPLTVFARAIKLADLHCNMEDMTEKDKLGSMYSKYKLAEYILKRKG